MVMRVWCGERRVLGLALVVGAMVWATGCGPNIRPELTVKEHPKPRTLQEAVQWEVASKPLASAMRLELEHLQEVDWPCLIRKRTVKNGSTLRHTHPVDYSPRGWPQTFITRTSPPGKRMYLSSAARNSYDGKGRLGTRSFTFFNPRTGQRMMELRDTFAYASDAGLIGRVTTMHTAKITNPNIATTKSYLWDHNTKRVQESTQAVRRNPSGRGWSPMGNPEVSRICSFSRHLIGPERCDGQSPMAVERGVTGRILSVVRPDKKTPSRTSYEYDGKGRVTRSVYTPNLNDPQKQHAYTYTYDAEHPSRLVRVSGEDRYSALAPPGKIVIEMTYICED